MSVYTYDRILKVFTLCVAVLALTLYPKLKPFLVL
jgi:hypothetical protein